VGQRKYLFVRIEGFSMAASVELTTTVSFQRKEASMAKYLLIAIAALFLAVGATAQDSMKKPASGGKVLVIVSHKVKDYASWRKGYDADQLNRAKAGFTVSGVYAAVNDPNNISVVGEFANAEAAEAFTTSPKLKEIMEKAGVIGKPEVKILAVAPK
jgi:hypothetical protein